jgi:hypothetical protein
MACARHHARRGPAQPLDARPRTGAVCRDLRARLRDLEDEYRRSQGPEAEWTAERLRALLRTQLSGDQVIVVSNREPYIHERTEGGVVVKRPASGLVTAVEPVMRACSGTWIAHGSGSADREVVDATTACWCRRAGRLLAAPHLADPEEEQGYYYGFANEGMWPLCHVAHVRPVFRESDWEAYRAVNQRFADAVVAEARSEDPVVLVQDYHFALLPAMIREKLPQRHHPDLLAHPLAQPGVVRHLPLAREILQGMLGSTILGFHTRYHCKNFIETVDRYLEARIEHEHSTIAFQDKETLVESYPISIEWPDDAEVAAGAGGRMPPPRDRAAGPAGRRLPGGGRGPLRLHQGHPGAPERGGAAAEKHPVVDRPLRLRAGGRADPQRAGRVPQLPGACAATSRPHQRALRPARLPAGAPAGAAPRARRVNELFRAADICVVTSLHDGMNLVCKEFVAARDDCRAC